MRSGSRGVEHTAKSLHQPDSSFDSLPRGSRGGPQLACPCVQPERSRVPQQLAATGTGKDRGQLSFRCPVQPPSASSPSFFSIGRKQARQGKRSKRIASPRRNCKGDSGLLGRRMRANVISQVLTKATRTRGPAGTNRGYGTSLRSLEPSPTGEKIAPSTMTAVSVVRTMSLGKGQAQSECLRSQ